MSSVSVLLQSEQFTSAGGGFVRASPAAPYHSLSDVKGGMPIYIHLELLQFVYMA